MPARRSSSIARSAWPRSTKTAIKVERSVGVMGFLLSEDLATEREQLASSSPRGPCQSLTTVAVGACRAFLYEPGRRRDALTCCSSGFALTTQSAPGDIAFRSTLITRQKPNEF